MAFGAYLSRLSGCRICLSRESASASLTYGMRLGGWLKRGTGVFCFYVMALGSWLRLKTYGFDSFAIVEAHAEKVYWKHEIS